MEWHRLLIIIIAPLYTQWETLNHLIRGTQQALKSMGQLQISIIRRWCHHTKWTHWPLNLDTLKYNCRPSLNQSSLLSMFRVRYLVLAVSKFLEILNNSKLVRDTQTIWYLPPTESSGVSLLLALRIGLRKRIITIKEGQGVGPKLNILKLICKQASVILRCHTLIIINSSSRIWARRKKTWDLSWMICKEWI